MFSRICQMKQKLNQLSIIYKTSYKEINQNTHFKQQDPVYHSFIMSRYFLIFGVSLTQRLFLLINKFQFTQQPSNCQSCITFLYMHQDQMRSIHSGQQPKHDIFDQMIEEKSISLTPSQVKRAMAQVTSLVRQVAQMRQQASRRQQQANRRQQQASRRQQQAYKMMEKILRESKDREEQAYRMIEKVIRESKQIDQKEHRSQETPHRRWEQPCWKEKQPWTWKKEQQKLRMQPNYHVTRLRDELKQQPSIREKNRSRSRQKKRPNRSGSKQTKLAEWIQKVKSQNCSIETACRNLHINQQQFASKLL